MILTLIATASTIPVAHAAWAEHLSNPLVRGILVALLTQIVKAVPQIPIEKGAPVAAVAAILSVLTGFLSALATGSLSGFSVDAAFQILVDAIQTLAAAFGTYEATGHAAALLTPAKAEEPAA